MKTLTDQLFFMNSLTYSREYFFSNLRMRIPTLQVSADDSDTAKMVQANSDNTFYVYNTTLDSTYPKKQGNTDKSQS